MNIFWGILTHYIILKCNILERSAEREDADETH